MVVGTCKRCADMLEVEGIAGFLLVEASVVEGPFVLGGWADIGVYALVVFVEGDVAGGYGGGENGRDV